MVHWITTKSKNIHRSLKNNNRIDFEVSLNPKFTVRKKNYSFQKILHFLCCLKIFEMFTFTNAFSVKFQKL